MVQGRHCSEGSTLTGSIDEKTMLFAATDGAGAVIQIAWWESVFGLKQIARRVGT